MTNQLKNELHKYFGYTTDCPTNASFNQRRAQIKSDAFKYLFENFTIHSSNDPSLFNGYRLIACDCSDINISHDPKDEETYFPHGEGKGFNQLHLNAMYDLLDIVYTNIVIQPARMENEHKAFCDMVDRYTGTEKTVFIVDRGYESYNNLAHVFEKGAFFLFRCKDINSSGILSRSKNKLPNAAVGLTSFHSKKREYIIQEIWARLILYNFCEVITGNVTLETCTKKHAYQINYTFAIHICRYVKWRRNPRQMFGVSI